MEENQHHLYIASETVLKLFREINSFIFTGSISQVLGT